ncbi:MAG: T9SS type A sorting domain-containing protein [bacterium]
MKYVYLLLLLTFFACVGEVNSQINTGMQPSVQNVEIKSLALPETNYSLLSTTTKDVKPIELNMNLVPDGENSKLEVGVVCNKTLGKLTLFSTILDYSKNPIIGEYNWLTNYIKTEWNPGKALISFPAKEGMTIDCKEGAIYHFEYKFDWSWKDSYNSIIALIYAQDPSSKEVIDVIRSSNILYSEFNKMIPSKYLTVTAGKDSYSEYIITNPTKENITFEAKIECSNLVWKIDLDKYIIKVPSEFSDTITLKIKTTPHSQYGNVMLTVTPMYLKDSYSVAETDTLKIPVITDGIELLALSNDILDVPGTAPWHTFLRDAVFAQPEVGKKSLFMDLDYWKNYFSDIDYKVMYIFGRSDNYYGWGTGEVLENAALNCIDRGKQLIVSSNVGLCINSKKLGSNFKITPQATLFYQKLGIEYRGYVDLPIRDTASLRIVTNHELNQDINETNTLINSGQPLSKRLDYIGITGANKETFPFLWYNRKYEPANSYAAVATVIGNSKIIYLSPGLETIGGVGDTLLIRNFLNWMLTPTDVTETKISNAFELYPNPAEDYITITSKPFEGFEPSEGSAIYVYNTVGEKVMSVGTGRDLTAKINISDLPKGIYFVKIGGETAKFVKM